VAAGLLAAVFILFALIISLTKKFVPRIAQ